MSQTSKTYLILSLIAVIGLALFGYFFIGGVFGGTTIGVSITTNPDLERGLVGHWTFDGKDLIENAVDRSGQGNTGYLSGFTSTSTAAGKLGQGIAFTGAASSTVSINGMSLSGSTGTIRLWIKPNFAGNDNGTYSLFHANANDTARNFLTLYKSGSNFLKFIIGDNVGAHHTVSYDISAWQADEWHDVSVVYDSSSSSISLYVDGALQDSLSESWTVDLSLTSQNIGSSDILLEDDFNGSSIDTNKWTVSEGELSVSLSNGEFVIDGTTTNSEKFTERGIVSKVGYTTPYIIKTKYRNVDAGSQFKTSMGADLSTYAGLLAQGGDIDIEYWTGSAWVFIANSTFTGSEMRFRQELYPSSSEIKWYENDSLITTRSVSIPSSKSIILRSAPNVVTSFDVRYDDIMVFALDESNNSNPIYSNFDGTIDDLRIYNRALSAAEIKRLYDLGATTKIDKTITTNPDLESGLVGHWTFDGANPGTDRSGNGNDGELFGVSTTSATVEGRIGQAFEFDGVDDYVVIGDIAAYKFELTDDFSVSAWVLRNDGGVTQKTIITKVVGATGGYTLFYSAASGGRIQWQLKDGSEGDGNQLLWSLFVCGQCLNDTWAHVVGTYDASVSTTALYVDGVLKDSDTSTLLDNIDNSGSLAISNSTSNWPGYIDDVRIYNRLLSAVDVKRLYQLGATTKINVTLNTNPDLESGLVGHWTFDGPDINTTNGIVDRSGQGNHGQFIGGATTSAAVEGRIGQALDFDGTDDYVDVSNSIDTSGAITVSFWNLVKTADVQESSAFAGFGTSNLDDRLQAHVPWSDSTLYWDYGDLATGRISTDYTSFLDTWTHVTLVSEGKGGSFKAIYLDGVLINSTSSSDGPDGTVIIDIGRIVQPTTGYHNGSIDDLRIYNRALSSDEIKRLYDLGR